jgi:hypothetical protein
MQAPRGKEYSSYSFLTSGLDGGEPSASRPGLVLSPGRDPRYLLERRLGGPHSLVWTQRLEQGWLTGPVLGAALSRKQSARSMEVPDMNYTIWKILTIISFSSCINNYFSSNYKYYVIIQNKMFCSALAAPLTCVSRKRITNRVVVTLGL